MKKLGSYSSLLNFRLIKGLLSMAVKGHLIERGWINSYVKKTPVDFNNNPIPWLTYSILDFLEERLKPDLSIFEYGSGNSTLYFEKKVKTVHSIEYDKAWFDLIRNQITDKVKIEYIPLEGDAYENAIINSGKLYDIVLVDGRKRVQCLKNAINNLSPGGVIILDDSEREKYQEAFIFMKEKGFKHLPFSGIAIGSIHGKCTSIFYRTNNVLDI